MRNRLSEKGARQVMSLIDEEASIAVAKYLRLVETFASQRGIRPESIPGSVDIASVFRSGFRAGFIRAFDIEDRNFMEEGA